MSTFYKGRVAVTAGMIAFMTATVLAGSSSATTAKVGGGAGNNNEPHEPGMCVPLKDVPTGADVHFYLVSPTAGPEVTAAPTQLGYSLDGLQQVAPTKQGWHVKVTVDGVSKTFWVGDGPGCLPVG